MGSNVLQNIVIFKKYIHHLHLQFTKCYLRLLFIKSVNNLVDVSTDGILNLITINTRGHLKRFKQLNANVDCFLHSFFPATIKIWNNLPENLTTHAVLQDFKKTIFET